jgi:pimeloyl-ACP methyl ester carboxylesterase
VTGFFILLGAGLVIAFAAMVAYTMYWITHPPRRTYASAISRGRPGDPGELPPGPTGPRTYEEWTLTVGALSLPVWDIPGDDARGPVIVLSHGWGDSRVGALSRVQRLAPLASRLIAWDMPGQGDAPGTCSLGTREVGALLALIERIGTGHPLVLFGWSLGGGVSIAAAAADPRIHAVIAEAPYRLAHTPARNVIAGFGYPGRMNLPVALSLLGWKFGVGPRWEGFDRAEHARLVSAPLLVLHGDADDVCPLADGREIAAAAPRGRFVPISGGGHHGLWTDEATAPRCTDAVREFLTGDSPEPIAPRVVIQSADAPHSH